MSPSVLCIFREHLLNPFELLPTDVRLVVVSQQHRPIGTLLPDDSGAQLAVDHA
jgi:hypothetical protein